MNSCFRNSSKKIFQILFSKNGKGFTEKVYRNITPKNTQEYHDKKEFENYKDNVRIIFT
jgi:hypothetical protein